MRANLSKVLFRHKFHVILLHKCLPICIFAETNICPMKRLLKKTLKIIGIIFILLIASAFLVPVLFKTKITNLVKQEINKNLTAKVDFSDVDISLFRHFPKVSVELNNLSIVGTGSFSSDTLVSAPSIDAAINLISFIKGSDMKIYSVDLQSPRLHLLVNKDGQANWSITKPSVSNTDTSSGEAFTINLEKYSVENAYMYYNDATANMNAEIQGLNHSGSSNMTADNFILTTNTHADKVSFTYDNIPYLAGNTADIKSDITVDMKNSKYSFSNADIMVNNLKVNTDGYFQIVNDSTYGMDIKFKAPSADFKDILSLVPAIYTQDFNQLKTSGTAAFEGFVKGQYSPQQLPAFDVKMQVKDGFFQYPDLPQPVKNIQLDMAVSNPDGQLDNTVVDIAKGHLEMDDAPFDFRVLFKNPETVKYIDAAIKGKLNLGDVGKFVKLESGTKLSGLLDADVFAKGSMNALENKSGDFSAGGYFNIQNLFYSSSSFPAPVQNGNIKATITNTGGVADNTTIAIPDGHVEVGDDPLDFSLNVANPVGNTTFSGNAKGKFNLDKVKQFVRLEDSTSVSGLIAGAIKFAGSKDMITKGQYDKMQTEGTVNLSNFKYASKDYPTGISIADAALAFNPKNITLTNLSGNYLHTNFSANGSLDNMIGYMMNNQLLTGNINFSADKINLNEWMGTIPEDTVTTNVSADPFLVPKNINLTLNAKAGDVVYDKVDYKNINGTLVFADETVKLQDVKTDALDGNITFNGSYSTKENKNEPAIALNYSVKDVDVQKAFLAFNTVQKLMPIGQFLAGKISSDLSMTGNLHADMMPDLSSLTGKGNMLLIQGVLGKFPPLEKLANTLNIPDLKGITLNDVKNYIEFANGKVLVKPFDIKVKDIDMEIGGLHGFDQSIDYVVQMKVPRKYFGSQGNALVNDLAAKANGNGIPVKLGETVDLTVDLTGSFTNPGIKTQLQQAAGNAADELKSQATQFAKAKADTVKQTVKDSLNSIKKDVTNNLKDELKNQLLGSKDSTHVDSTAPKPGDNIKKKAENTLKSALNKFSLKKKNN